MTATEVAAVTTTVVAPVVMAAAAVVDTDTVVIGADTAAVVIMEVAVMAAVAGTITAVTAAVDMAPALTVVVAVLQPRTMIGAPVAMVAAGELTHPGMIGTQRLPQGTTGTGTRGETGAGAGSADEQLLSMHMLDRSS